MKIKSLIVGGFKGVQDKVIIPLSSITLLFGANSTGKSTVLHALLYLYEVIVARNFDPQYSQVTGEKLWLGGFQNLVHGKKTNNVITLGATLDFSDGVDVWNDFLSTAETWLLESHLGFTPDATTKVMSFEIDIEWDNFAKKTYISRFECFSCDQPYLRFESQAGKQESVITHYSPLSDWQVSEPFEINNIFESGEWEAVYIPSRDALPPLIKRIDLSNCPFDWSNVFPEHPLAAQVFAEAALSQSSLAPLRILGRKLFNLLHIGPLRVVPCRNFILEETATPARWYDGSAGWDQFAYGSESLRKQVNEYFGKSFLESNYIFDIQKIPDETIKYRQVILKETQTSTNLRPSDVGIGVSQVFPFIVACSINQDAIISCEQPELHIHPKWQLSLADMILESCYQNSGRMFLIETHSEHIMLRLLKRRRQTADEVLSVDDHFSCFKHDVQIIFCEQVDGKTIFRTIKTTDEGEFDSYWPNGFF